MKKTFFHYAMALCLGLCLTACSDDEESAPNYGINLPAAKYADKAVSLTIRNTSAVSATPAPGTVGNAPTLRNVNITEGGMAVFETVLNGSKKYAVAEVSINGNTYTLANGKGTIVVTSGRAGSTVRLSINVTIDIAGVGTFTYSTQGNSVEASEESNTASGGQVLDYMARAWDLEAITLDLKGDVDAFRIFKNGDLKAIRDYAIDQGASISAEESKEFNRVITSINITKTGLMTINYDDGRVDAASWEWIDTENFTKLGITFKDFDMGNKFLNNESAIEVKFSEDMCLLVIGTKITGSKNYDASVSIRLRARK